MTLKHALRPSPGRAEHVVTPGGGSFGDIEWTCPKHGFVATMPDGDLSLCAADDSGRKTGICFRECGGPMRIADTGEVIGEDFAEQAQVAREATVGKLKAGARTCEQCAGDMAGEHSRAARCGPCRDKVPTDAWRRQKEARAAQDGPDSAPVAPARSSSTDGAGSKTTQVTRRCTRCRAGMEGERDAARWCTACRTRDKKPTVRVRRGMRPAKGTAPPAAPVEEEEAAGRDLDATVERVLASGPEIPLLERVRLLEEIGSVAILGDLVARIEAIEKTIYGKKGGPA